nr:hypothetical protein CFP56_22797 [Quercus suber]
MKGKGSTIMRILYEQNYAETKNARGSLDCLYDLLSKFSVLEGSAELLLKPMTKGYSVKDMSTADATKSMVKAASGYD